MKRYVLKPSAGVPDRFARYRGELNAEQFRVVTSPPKASLVVAGAGSGKTRVITYRVAYLLEQGVSPDRILLATFTNRAAREMLHRVEALTGSQNVHRVWGGTFHRIANLMLRRHAVSMGYENNYSILDSEDARDLIGLCIEDAGIETKKRRFPKAEVIQGVFSLANNTDTPINEIVISRYPYFEPFTRELDRIDSLYQLRKVERNVMDYDDLLLNWKKLLVERPEIGKLYAEQFQHILVDEYQDTNRLQAEIIDLLAIQHKNVMVVGDDAQSIFAWRGAEFANIYEFPKRYRDAEVYKLEQNYRSTPEILALANVSISCNRRQFPKTLEAVRRSRGFLPALIPCSDVDQQSNFIASRILELRDEGASLEDMSVLYRSHYHSMELQLELSRRGIPYRIRSGVRFFEQAHIKDVVSYLRIIINPRDELAWKRILKMIPGIGKATANKIYESIALVTEPRLLSDGGEGVDTAASIQKLRSFENKRGASAWKEFVDLLDALVSNEMRDNPSRQVTHILDTVYEAYLKENFENAESRIEDIRGLAAYAQKYRSTDEMLSDLALLSTESFKEPQPLGGEDVISASDPDEMLTLTSIHQAKGLEWRIVFLLWAAEGKFPSPRSLREPESEEEERRLWYVALTRAKDELYVSYPLLMTDHNRQAVLQKPSRFITEVPIEMFEVWQVEEPDLLVDHDRPAIDAPQEFIN